MFRFPPRENLRHLIALITLMMTGISSYGQRATTPNYAADPVLAKAEVDVGLSAGGAVFLASLFALIESETGMPVEYPPGQFSIGTEVALESGTARIPLAQLLARITAQTGIVFEHRNGEILASRAVAPAPRAASPASAPVLTRTETYGAEGWKQAPVPDPTGPEQSTLTTAFAAEVNALVNEGGGSRVKREKRLAVYVREQIASAVAETNSDEEALEVAIALTQAAAAAAPEYVATIASAASFASGVSRLKGGASQVRAAAFAAARGGSSRSPAPAADEPVIPRRTSQREFQPEGAPEPTSQRIRIRGYQPVESIPAAPDEPAPAAPAPASSTVTFSTPYRSEVPAAPLATPPEPASSVASAPAGETATAAPTAPAFNFGGTSDTGSSGISFPNTASTGSSGTVGSDGVITMEKFGVEAEATRGSAMGLQTERQRANVSMDFLSADQLAKFGAADLSDIVFRIPGVSVAGGQFAVVRGLSDRYLSTTLQGIKLPSPDPEKQAFQLDLLPTSAIEAVVVAKAFDPAQWAESGAGNMDIRTRAIPEEQQLRISAGIKYNSNAAEGGPDYRIRNSAADRFGFGSRSRLAPGTFDPAWQYVPTYRKSFPLGNKFGLEYTKSVLFGDQQLGLLVSAFNEASYRVSSGRLTPRAAVRGDAARPGTGGGGNTSGVPSDFEKPTRGPSNPSAFYTYGETSTDNVTGVTLGLGYKLAPEHELSFSAIWVQSGVDLARINQSETVIDSATGRRTYTGRPPAEGSAFADFPYNWYTVYEYFKERNLTALQLNGNHSFAGFNDLEADWAIQRANSYQKDNPYFESTFAAPFSDPTRFILPRGSDVGVPIFAVWADNRERQDAARTDFKLPLQGWTSEPIEVRFGGAVESSTRDVNGFGRPALIPSSVDLEGPDPSALVGQASRFAAGVFQFDSRANRDIRAFYLNTLVPIIDGFKATLGARNESFSLQSTGIGRWGNYTSTDLYVEKASLLRTTAAGAPPFKDRRWYPAAGLIISPLDNLTLRFNYSTTSGRPSFREVMPFFNKSIDSGNLVIGNPALQPSDVSSFDLRAEWMPLQGTTLSASLFSKRITNPIEKFIVDTRASAGEFTEVWAVNRNTAKLYGLELEFTHALKSWSEFLDAFSVSGNFTLIDAEVPEALDAILQVNPGVITFFQNPDNIPRTRRLFDQPRYIGNVEVTWNAVRWGSSITASVFAISESLIVAGLSRFDFDLYEKAYYRVDLSFNQKLTSALTMRLSVKNLNDPVRGSVYDPENTTGYFPRTEYRAGREFGLSLTSTF